MKTVTAAFTDALKAPSTPFVRQVYYKRRYWVETSKSYSWESSWTLLSEDKVAGCSQITWQLDIQTLNQFQTANITLKLENLQNQWRGDNPFGKFAKDSLSPVYGYNPFWTKFQVRAGLVKTDHTTETVPVFTGVATEYNYDTLSGTVQVTVSGEESLLINASAEAVSTTVTNEVLTGAVDGANKVFTTAQSGVGIVKEVSDNGATKRQGTDYTISNLNIPAIVATITFLVAPTAAHTIRGSYLYWKASQKFEDLVTALLNQAGIPGGSQQVSPVVFPNSVINTHVYQTQADWQGGSLSEIDAVSFPNSILFQYFVAQTWNDTTAGWTETESGGVLPSFSSDGTGIFFTGGGGAFKLEARASTNVVGEWRFSYQIPTTGATQISQFTAWFMADINNGTNGIPNQGYGLSYADTSNTTFQLELLITNGSGGDAIIGSIYAGTRDTATHAVRIRRYADGRFYVYLDGALIISATSTTWTASTYFLYYFNQNTGTPKIYLTAGSMATPAGSDGIGTWIASALDFSTTPTSWTQFQSNQNTYAGTISYFTASSADNISYDAYVAVPANGVVASTLRRYLKVKVVFAIAGSSPGGDPITSSITVGAVTSSTGVTLANFTGMSCYDAITALGKFANYEFGFAPSETFYFRPKAVTKSAVMAIDQQYFNLQLDQVVNGYDRVYSAVRATYAGYLTDVVDDGLYYAGPLAVQGFNRIQIDGGAILVSADADVATGVAGSFFNYFKFPRRRVKVTTKIIPQIDLSDVIQVTLADNLLKGWYVGDTSVALGDTSLALYGGEEQVVYGLIMKVIGVRIDTDNWLTQFDLEEVL